MSDVGLGSVFPRLRCRNVGDDAHPDTESALRRRKVGHMNQEQN